MNSFVLLNQTHPHFSLPWTEVKVQASFKSFLYKLVISWNKTKAGVPIIKKKKHFIKKNVGENNCSAKRSTAY